ncbi:hypothetical protein TK90_2804 (plasmid) [Thioalkalivibrio sp. K90mix]|uniref:hypothetical protein n=1 Tax=Thioalkalivibrio sp. (strain K90mix) TaxID=396595 RepID=UPI000195A722|nr:hypothetical protein [Thioalkalivibrio sp. K90mix]ADC73289.1 hypothetical protein TK90_2804 [Thioalkalivibrio sp. K90mix]
MQIEMLKDNLETFNELDESAWLLQGEILGIITVDHLNDEELEITEGSFKARVGQMLKNHGYR